MSLEACRTFLRKAYDSPELTKQLKVVTASPEIIRLGLRHGYAFDLGELIEASSSLYTESGAGTTQSSAQSPVRTMFYHHEYQTEEIPGLVEGVLDELPKLKVRPPSVDLARFELDFREEDLRSTAMSPAGPGFRSWHEHMMQARPLAAPGGRELPRRDFHLINLDEHVERSDYDCYFHAKVKTLSTLETLFQGQVQFSSSLWYPPFSYRLWHTNETQPGWRMYIVNVDDEMTNSEVASFFRYMHPETGELVTLHERTTIVRFFRVEQDPHRLFWHCIVNPTPYNRWSFGFAVPENWAESLPSAAE